MKGWAWCVAILAWVPVMVQAQNGETRKMTEESRAVVMQLLQRVGGEMRRELEYSSPTAAILVCKYSSPEIASELSRKTGWRIARVSLKPRNPAMGTPDAWEQKVLAEFDRRAASGEKVGGLEYAEIVSEPAGRFFRFIKALPVAPLCLTCHGPAESLAESVKARLAKEYPYDKATGYSVGQVRGAVTVKRPLQQPVGR